MCSAGWTILYRIRGALPLPCKLMRFGMRVEKRKDVRTAGVQNTAMISARDLDVLGTSFSTPSSCRSSAVCPQQEQVCLNPCQKLYRSVVTNWRGVVPV